MPSCAVSSTQSPWHQMPGKRSKYAARYFAPSSSFQKPSGIDGNGAVQTSSPFCRRTGLPFSSYTSTFMPRPRHWSSPRQTGRVGQPSAKQEMMSVPPPPKPPNPDQGRPVQFRVLARWESAKPVRLAGGPELPEFPGQFYVIRLRGLPLMPQPKTKPEEVAPNPNE